MISLVLALLLAQANPPQDAAKPPAPAPAKPPAPAAPAAPPSARLEKIITTFKGQPPAFSTERLGPPGNVRQGIDGVVYFWQVSLPTETVCGVDLQCVQKGGGDCGIAMAFKDQGGMIAWKTDGDPKACEAAADLLEEQAKAIAAEKPK